MSTQQADLLTSELWALRRAVEPAMRKICQTYLALEGLDNRVEIQWDDISLQDITQEAQADLLTNELWAIRRAVEPAIRKICRTFLVLEGLDPAVEIEWDEISLQDMAETARAELYAAQAAKLKAEN